jgi:hypothetical protein
MAASVPRRLASRSTKRVRRSLGKGLGLMSIGLWAGVTIPARLIGLVG